MRRLLTSPLAYLKEYLKIRAGQEKVPAPVQPAEGDAGLAISPMRDDLRVLFVHIPKTGGISIYNVLSQAIGADRSRRFAISSQSEQDLYLNMADEELRGYGLLSGHFPLSFFLMKPVRDYKAITVVRHPVDRELSSYFYVKTQPEHPLNTDWFQSLNLYQYLDYCEQQGNINPQCMFVCGERSFKKAKAAIDERYFLSAPLDHLDAFLKVLGERLAVQIGPPVHENRTPLRLTADEIHPDIKRRFERLTEGDMRLYAYVKEKFEKAFL